MNRDSTTSAQGMRMSGAERVLLVDDEPTFADALADGLSVCGFEVIIARSIAEATSCFGDISLVVLDLNLGDGSGLDLLRLIQSMGIDVDCVVLTGDSRVDSAVAALRLGAFHYLQKPVDLDDLAEVLRQASERRATRVEIERMRTRMAEEGRLAALGRVAAGLAHEVNNPIAVVLAGMHAAGRDLDLLQKLAGSLPDPEARERAVSLVEGLRSIVDDSRVAARRVADIVKRVKPLAGAASGRAVVDAGLVLQAAGDVVRSGLTDATLAWDCDGALGVLVEANAAELMDVAVHLASNALRAVTGAAGGEVRVRATADDFHLHLVVEDNGKGIGADHLPLIFDPFFTTQPPGQGMGLGLALVRELLSRMGGAVEIDSREGEGTTVHASLPRRVEEVSGPIALGGRL